jgi:hypothetical protein
MDVKGAKALSERLAEAARNVEPLTREQREIIRKQIDALMRERLGGEPSRRGPRHKGDPLKTPRRVKSRSASSRRAG